MLPRKEVDPEAMTVQPGMLMVPTFASLMIMVWKSLSTPLG